MSKRQIPATDSTSERLIGVLTAAWQAIRSHHPEVPDAVVLPMPHNGKAKLGHFSAVRWRVRDATSHEVCVVAECLDRPGLDTMEVLVHEAAHALNYARGVKDCSANQYHNRKFRAAAEELGLCVVEVSNYGHSETSHTPATSERYADHAKAIEAVAACRLGPKPGQGKGGKGGGAKGGGAGGASGDEGEVEGEGGSKSRQLKATCECGFIIRLSRAVFEATVIYCAECEGRFALADE